jgi:hypothetical protein
VCGLLFCQAMSANMLIKSKRTSLIILAITALILSRLMFLLFNDPEGPNLGVVTGMALIVYVPSLVIFVFRTSTTRLVKLLLAIVIQIIIVTVCYFLLK